MASYLAGTRVSPARPSSGRVHAFDRAAARRGVCRNLYLGKNQDCLNRCFDVNFDILTMGERMMPMAFLYGGLKLCRIQCSECPRVNSTLNMDIFPLDNHFPSSLNTSIISTLSIPRPSSSFLQPCRYSPAETTKLRILDLLT